MAKGLEKGPVLFLCFISPPAARQELGARVAVRRFLQNKAKADADLFIF